MAALPAVWFGSLDRARLLAAVHSAPDARRGDAFVAFVQAIAQQLFSPLFPEVQQKCSCFITATSTVRLLGGQVEEAELTSFEASNDQQLDAVLEEATDDALIYVNLRLKAGNTDGHSLIILVLAGYFQVLQSNSAVWIEREGRWPVGCQYGVTLLYNVQEGRLPPKRPVSELPAFWQRLKEAVRSDSNPEQMAIFNEDDMLQLKLSKVSPAGSSFKVYHL